MQSLVIWVTKEMYGALYQQQNPLHWARYEGNSRYLELESFASSNTVRVTVFFLLAWFIDWQVKHFRRHDEPCTSQSLKP